MKAKYLCLAIPVCLLLSLAMSGMASAAETTVTFDGSNPDITIISQHQLKAGYSTLRETSTFTLTGNGDVIGSITASTGTYHCSRTLPKAELRGGYTATNGDFGSMFESSNLTWKSNPCSTTVPEMDSAMFFSQQSLSATGVTTMTVVGDASAKCGWGQPLSSEQTFSGNALEVDILGFNARQEMLVDSNLHPVLDADGNFQYAASSDWATADLDGAAQGSSPIDFGGSTGGSYRNNPSVSSSARRSSLDYDLWLQEPKYTVYPNPLTALVDIYAPGALSIISNAYTSLIEVWGDINFNFG